MNTSGKIKLAVITAVDGTMAGLVFAQLKAAQQTGYEVHGVCTEGPQFEWLTNQGVHMHAVTIKRCMSPFSDLATLWKLFRLFRSQRFDIVHTHTPKVSLLGQLAAKLAGVPVIVNTVHGYYFHENMKSVKRWFYILMEWIASRCSSFVLSQNPEDVETAVRLKIVRPDKIKTLGNGIDLTKFDPALFDEEEKAAKRKEIGIPEDAIVVGMIGRLVREKGYLELFSAIKVVMESNDRLWLLLVGAEEPEKPDRISGHTFKEYEIAGRTRWLGKCSKEKIPGLLACCDIYTLPSWREGFPRSGIEAAAMGLPIVMTNIRGCRQVVDDGVNGFLVPLKDSVALPEVLDKLVKNSELRDRMGCEGYKKARREFDENQVCKIVLETYTNILDKGAKG